MANPAKNHRRNTLARDIFVHRAAQLHWQPVKRRDSDAPGDATSRMWQRQAQMAFDAADAFEAELFARDNNILDQMGHKP